MPRRNEVSSARAVQAADRLVAQRIRHRRLMLGLSQEQLAQRLKVSYQQVQKYETGLNRISAGRLAQIAAALDSPIAEFFTPTDAQIGARGEDSEAARQTLELVRNFSAISDPRIREGLAALTRALAISETGARLPDSAQTLRNLDIDTAEW